MRMGEIGSQAVYATLQTVPALTDLVGSCITNRPFAAEELAYPFCLHYAEPGGAGYGAALNSLRLPDTLVLRYVVRLICEGESTDPIDPAADAILQRFSQGYLVSPVGYQVIARPLEPWPQILGAGAIEEGGVIYSETGDFYELEILRTGV